MSAPSTSLVVEFKQKWEKFAQEGLIAFEDSNQKISYQQLIKRVGKTAGYMRAMGVRKNDRIAIAIEKSIEQAIYILGCLVAGACPYPLEPNLSRDEIERRFSIAKIKWLVLDENTSSDPLFFSLSDVSSIVINDSLSFEEYWALDITLEDPSFLLFTSGSSGKSKGVLQSHRGSLVNALGVISATELTSVDRLLHIMPMHHTNGVNNQLFAPLLSGATICMAKKFSPTNMPQLLELHQPTLITGVPTMFSRLLDIEFSKQALSQLRLLRCGSAPITEELHSKVEQKFNCKLVVSYGLSEATCTSTMNPPSKRKIGSVGKVLSGQEVFIDFSKGGDGDDSGEICIKGPSLMMGYLDENSNGMPVLEDSVLHTGDVGHFDSEGYLYITGRIKDIIIRGGENISPNLIEEVICSVNGIQSCCVVGRFDSDLGEVPVVFIVRKNSLDGINLSSKEIDAVILEKLSKSYIPAEYFYLNSLPENSVGKVDRKELKRALSNIVNRVSQ